MGKSIVQSAILCRGRGENRIFVDYFVIDRIIVFQDKAKYNAKWIN